MAQKFETIDGEIEVSVDLPIPPNTDGPVLNRNVTIVDNFLEGERRDFIAFELDERFRDRALAELVARGEGIDIASTMDNRDFGNNISVDLNSETPVYISALMRSPVYRPTIAYDVIDRDFKEFA